MITAGFDEPDPLPQDPSITDLAPLTLAHFGVEAPASMRARLAARV
jgi:hypothetical protein